MPYLDLEVFNADVAKAASGAARGLCIFAGAMKDYYYAAKIVRPKLEALSIALAQLDEANKNLKAAEDKLSIVQAKVAELQRMFEAQMAEKKKIEDGANALARKAQQASDLINGLAGEQKRWGEDAENLVIQKHKLVGDCAVAAAFVSYCGPFNQEFRTLMVKDKFTKDCIDRNVPVSMDLDVISFSVNQSTIADWNMEGLPTDPLSIQNGILITQASRYPLLVDPQGQALKWIKSREKERTPHYGTTTLAHSKLKDQLEYAMAEGMALIVIQVENTIDPSRLRQYRTPLRRYRTPLRRYRIPYAYTSPLKWIHPNSTLASLASPLASLAHQCSTPCSSVSTSRAARRSSST